MPASKEISSQFDTNALSAKFSDLNTRKYIGQYQQNIEKSLMSNDDTCRMIDSLLIPTQSILFINILIRSANDRYSTRMCACFYTQEICRIAAALTYQPTHFEIFSKICFKTLQLMSWWWRLLQLFSEFPLQFTLL